MITDFHDPTIQVDSAVPAPDAPPVQAIWPDTLRRFRFLEDQDACAYLDRIDPLKPEPMVPTLALEKAAASLPADGFRQVVVVPRRGPSFRVVLHRGRHGLVYAQD
jgi:hypothetical protein